MENFKASGKSQRVWCKKQGIKRSTLRYRLERLDEMSEVKEVKSKDGKLYVSAIFDCFDLMPLGLSIEDNMCASLCCRTLENAKKAYPDINGCIIHSDRGSQYTSAEYRTILHKYGILQSMNSAGGRCHDDCVKFYYAASQHITLYHLSARKCVPYLFDTEHIKNQIKLYYCISLLSALFQ